MIIRSIGTSNTLLISKELKYSLFLIFTVLLVLMFKVPLEAFLLEVFDDPLISKPIAGSTIRLALIAGLLYFINKKGLLTFNGLSPFLVSNLWILGVAVVVTLVLAFSSYEVYREAEGGRLFLFGLNNALVGMMEELLLRGIVFPLLIIHFAGKQRSILKAAFLSSVLFGLAHLTLLVRDPEKVVQVSYVIIYAIGIGFLFACVLLRTKNILIPAFIHFLIDFTNGVSDLQREVAVKEVPTLSTIIITYAAIILMALFFIGVGLWLFKRVNKEEWLQKVSFIKL